MNTDLFLWGGGRKGTQILASAAPNLKVGGSPSPDHVCIIEFQYFNQVSLRRMLFIKILLHHGIHSFLSF